MTINIIMFPIFFVFIKRAYRKKIEYVEIIKKIKFVSNIKLETLKKIPPPVKNNW